MRRLFQFLLVAGLLCTLTAPAFAGYIFTFTAPDVTSGGTTFPGLVISVDMPALYGGVGIWDFTGASFAALNPVLTGGAPGTTVSELEIHRNVGFDEATFVVNLPSPAFTNDVVYRFQDAAVEYDATGSYLQNDSLIQGYPNPSVVFFNGTLDISIPEPRTALLAFAGLMAAGLVRKLLHT